MNEDKATRYHRLRRRADAGALLVAAGALVALAASGAALRLREMSAGGSSVLAPAGFEEPVTVAVFALLLLLILHLVELPFALYQGYRLEHRYGLSTQSFGHWARDHAKGALVGGLLGVVGVSVVYATMRWWGSWWWLASAGLFIVGGVILAQLAPVLLLPLFFRIRPLERPALVQRLLALAARARTEVLGVFEWALSAHTRKANAALAGIGRTRRILLSDTLLADYSDDEIEVVLAHELSHHVHHDLWRGMALQAAVLVVSFYGAHLALGWFAGPLALRGLDDPAGLPMLLVAGGVCALLCQPLAHALSRAHERRADRYALELTSMPAPFISAMQRLSQQNLAEERPSRLVQWLFHSHPPIRERIDFARRWAPANAILSRRRPH